jgi:hypothetical protein
MVHNLSTNILLETYKKAIELKLSKDFIELLYIELDKRFIDKIVIDNYEKVIIDN